MYTLPPTNMEVEHGLLEDCFLLLNRWFTHFHDCFSESI